MKHRSNLKHASVAKARAEDKENEARKDVKVVEDELRLAREEKQAVKGDLWAKIAALEWARQEALEAGNSVERLTEELWGSILWRLCFRKSRPVLWRLGFLF